ncbi:MAG: endonuclease III [Candidatus Omnitrophota bacterium]|nr:endonuclease III [Candidatus Omnitrophota bacterium]
MKLLNKAYGRPKPFRRSEPTDELVRTVLSQNTNDRNSLAAFAVLKKNFQDWDALLKTNTHQIARLIKHAGLADIKAKRIRAALKEIKRREGRISLRRLKSLSIENSLGYLRSLNGVGPKTAACVLLFSFGRPVMPVDTHIFRVAKRLGLIDKKIDIEEAQEVLTDFTLRRGRLRRPSPEKTMNLIYEFHLGIIEHGRRTCKAHNLLCGTCVLYDLCRFKDKGHYKRTTR